MMERHSTNMDTKKMAEIIRGLSDCIRENPNQFHYEVHSTMTGVSATAKGPGSIGRQATAVGGQGGTVIGANIQPQFGDVAVEFVQAQATAAIREQLNLAVMLLGHIASQLEANSGDTKSLRNTVDRLAQLSLPAIVSETVRLLLRSIGLLV